MFQSGCSGGLARMAGQEDLATLKKKIVLVDKLVGPLGRLSPVT